MKSSNYAVGIDIGSSHIAITGCDFLEGNKSNILHQVLVPSNGVDGGYITDINKAAESLMFAKKLFEKKSRSKLKEAFFTIGGISLQSHVVRASINISNKKSEIDDRDISEIIEKIERGYDRKHPNLKILQISPISYEIDDRQILGSPIGDFGEVLSSKAVVITVSERHYESLVHIADLAKIDILDDLVAAPIADAAACLSDEQKKLGCVLVNIGLETTQVSIYEHGNITHLNVFDSGSSKITTDLALAFQIPVGEAEEVKKGKSIKYPRKEVESIKEQRIVELISHIEYLLKKKKKNRLLPSGIIWTGNGSLVENINLHSKKILSIPSIKYSLELPKNNINKARLNMLPKFSTSYGLCRLEYHDYVPLFNFSLSRMASKIKYLLRQLLP